MIALPTGTRLENFVIDRVLGQGGFGITYLADDETLHRHVAIKEYFPQDWASREGTTVSAHSSSKGDYEWGLKSFLKEARTLARFKHPSIVHVNRIIEANGTAYMVLNYEEGDDFGQWLEQLGRPPTQKELDGIVAKLLDALALVHKNNILHRDIAPDNIKIRRDGTPVLLDFGAAREAMSQRTNTVTGIFKPGYSPVEQYSTDAALQGRWSDIYALGATLYRAVTGNRPPDSPMRAAKDTLEPASEVATGDFRPGFLAAIDHALQRQHENRPRNVKEWRKELFASADARERESTAAGAATDEPRAAEERGRPGLFRYRWAAALLVALLGAAAYLLVAPARDDPRRACLQKENDTDKIINSCSKVIADGLKYGEPIVAAVYKARGAANLKKGEYARAITDYSDALNTTPGDFEAHRGRGRAHFAAGHYDAAIADFSAIDDAASRARVYKKIGRRRLAIADFRRIVGSSSDRGLKEELSALLLSSDTLKTCADENTTPEARISTCGEVIEGRELVHTGGDDPVLVRAYISRGKAILGRRFPPGDPQKALADFEKAIRLDPKSAMTVRLRGEAHLRLGKPGKAIADLNEAIARNPRDADAHRLRGEAELQRNEYDRAIADLTTAIGLAPSDAAAYELRGNAYSAKRDYTRALADFDKLIGLTSGNADLHADRAADLLRMRAAVFYKAGDYDKAIADLGRAIELNPSFVEAYFERGAAHQKKGDAKRARADFEKVVELDPAHAQARAKLAEIKPPGAKKVAPSAPKAPPPVPPDPKQRKPGAEFRDCPQCPVMVVLPPGEFTMGSPPDEEGRDKNEGPPHKVTIARPFAVGKFEVTFAEWDACVADGGCNGYKPRDRGWGRGKRPVIHVSWNNAKSYLAWLSKKTGKSYRLLTEAEWEYAARAGTTTPFATGKTITSDQANFDARYSYNGSPKGKYREKTSDTGAFPPNAFGLHDMHGNVFEWVADCWHDSYEGAPADGSARATGNCGLHVVRGGSWTLVPQHLRSAKREALAVNYHSLDLGFRVARTAAP